MRKGHFIVLGVASLVALVVALLARSDGPDAHRRAPAKPLASAEVRSEADDGERSAVDAHAPSAPPATGEESHLGTEVRVAPLGDTDVISPTPTATLVVFWEGDAPAALDARRASTSEDGTAYGLDPDDRVTLVSGEPVVLEAPSRWRVKTRRDGERRRECGTLELEPGGRYELRCGRARLTHIAGLVVGPDGRPVANATVRSTRRVIDKVVQPFEVDTTSDEDGIFEVEFERDHSRPLKLSIKRSGIGSAHIEVPITPGNEHELGTIALQPGASYSGVGTGLRTEDGLARFGVVVPGGPLERAGGRMDDVITAIDGRPVAGLERDAVISLIRGEPGTTVTFDLRRGDELFTLAVVRELITSP